ncbi:unnamed protein product, partial [Prorocentrum cordatum]
DFSWDFRNCLHFLFREHFQWACDEQRFDAQVVRVIGGNVRSSKADGEAWRRSALAGSFARRFSAGGHRVRIAAESGEVAG